MYTELVGYTAVRKSTKVEELVVYVVDKLEEI